MKSDPQSYAVTKLNLCKKISSQFTCKKVRLPEKIETWLSYFLNLQYEIRYCNLQLHSFVTCILFCTQGQGHSQNGQGVKLVRNLWKFGFRGFTRSKTHQFWPICQLHIYGYFKLIELSLVLFFSFLSDPFRARRFDIESPSISTDFNEFVMHSVMRMHCACMCTSEWHNMQNGMFSIIISNLRGKHTRRWLVVYIAQLKNRGRYFFIIIVYFSSLK